MERPAGSERSPSKTGTPQLIRRLPPRPKQRVTDLIALNVYWPLSRLASLAEATGLPVASFT